MPRTECGGDSYSASVSSTKGKIAIVGSNRGRAGTVEVDHETACVADRPTQGDATSAIDIERQSAGTSGGRGDGQKRAAGGVEDESRGVYGDGTGADGQRVAIGSLRDELDARTDATGNFVDPSASSYGSTKDTAVVKRNPTNVVDGQGVEFHVRIGATSGICRGNTSCPSHAAVEA